MEKLKTENRKCIFKKTVCTFHGFFQRSMVLEPALVTLGAIDVGVIAYPVAIIEDKKGKLMEVEATSIRFVEDKQCF